MRTYKQSMLSPCATCAYEVDVACTAPGGEFNGRSHIDRAGHIVQCDRKVVWSRPMVKRKRAVKSIYDLDLIQTYKTVRHV